MTEQWTCGHHAGAARAECYRELAEKAAIWPDEVERNELEISSAAWNRLLLEVATLGAHDGARVVLTTSVEIEALVAT